MEPTAVLRADPIERDILVAVIAEGQRLSEIQNRNLATMIISELARAMEKGRKKAR